MSFVFNPFFGRRKFVWELYLLGLGSRLCASVGRKHVVSDQANNTNTDIIHEHTYTLTHTQHTDTHAHIHTQTHIPHKHTHGTDTHTHIGNTIPAILTYFYVAQWTFAGTHLPLVSLAFGSVALPHQFYLYFCTLKHRERKRERERNEQIHHVKKSKWCLLRQMSTTYTNRRIYTNFGFLFKHCFRTGGIICTKVRMKSCSSLFG